ncbi:bis(5'-nucleosyl)-tetraphosphatase PrpE [Halalkalibacter urbisdiaboli]|uniref:bis(5'-nucleosyl)-tetraphosphatase PrpE n=1 Tax=Halalkalibacter urbisdiaboli TaxID=1960589 RepID=UPI000B43044E|nr:bis(5'-nucleosyl)-tetraphosphatase PrpE [Halalkalibacter urbisdiaboli]
MQIDCIGDIHGCFDELSLLVEKLGYVKKDDLYLHPDGRKLAFIGDLTDRGPRSLDVIELVSKLVEAGHAFYVPGNHCDKLYRYFLGRKVQQTHGLETTVAELQAVDNRRYKKIKAAFMKLIETSPLYQVLDHKQLVVAHAGIQAKDIGQTTKRVKTFVLYGDITGETNPDGTPVRRDWAQHYQGDAWVVYGHTPVKEARFVHRTVNIDTGCVFGGKLSALRYPEMTVVDVPSSLPYVEEKFRSFD